MRFLQFLWFLPAIVAGAATEKKCTKYENDYNVKYDDLQFNDGNPSPIPPHYYGLSYFTFQVDQYDGFIHAASGTQYAMAYGGSGNISIPDSPYDVTLQLRSFAFACNSGIPQPKCAIEVWAHRANGRVKHKTIFFPRLDSGHYPDEFVMNTTTFGSGWDKIKSLGFSIARADNGGDIYGGLMIDNLQYTLVEKVCS